MSYGKYVVSNLVNRTSWLGRGCRLYSTQHQDAGNSRDPAPYFFNAEVQSLLSRLTGVNYDKVFSAKKFGKQSTVPIQRFMTKEQLDKEFEEVSAKASAHLQMPPVLAPAAPVEESVTRDPELEGYEKSKLVFTDISTDIPHHERLVVVREPTGELNKPDWMVRDRILQAYYPRAGKKLYPLPMFQGENLQRLLDSHSYIFILDSACLQFEPYDPEFIAICEQVYTHVDLAGKYAELHSTRYYGCMLFTLLWKKYTHNIMEHYLLDNRLDDCCGVIDVYRLIHPDTYIKSADTDHTITRIQDFIDANIEVSHRSRLHMCIQKLSEAGHSAEAEAS